MTAVAVSAVITCVLFIAVVGSLVATVSQYWPAIVATWQDEPSSRVSLATLPAV